MVDNLRELSLTSTSKGMLYKCIGNIDGKKVFIKTGTKFKNRFSVLEPISEVIASEIISKFNIECVHNELKMMKLPIEQKEILASVSYDFLEEGETLLSARTLLGTYSGDNLYQDFINIVPKFKCDIDKMIIMDFLINNIDRHLRNFSVIVKGDEIIKFSPLYDHGLSLYADIQDFELEQDDEQTWEMIDECKPFKESHYKQLDLIDNVNLPKVLLEDILLVVDKYSNYISEYRANCIKYLLSTRYNHLVERGIL